MKYLLLLYPSKLKNWFLDRAKAPRFDDRKGGRIIQYCPPLRSSNPGSFRIGPKTNFLVYLGIIILMGCAAKAETDKKAVLTKTTLQIRTNENTNQGTPFYVVIKSTDYSQFLVDDYKKIATEAMVGDKDPDKLNATCFIPGETKTIEVENKDNKPVGVYFIFTHPGEEWKYLTDEKEGSKVKILLGENEIKSVRSF